MVSFLKTVIFATVLAVSGVAAAKAVNDVNSIGASENDVAAKLPGGNDYPYIMGDSGKIAYSGPGLGSLLMANPHILTTRALGKKARALGKKAFDGGDDGEAYGRKLAEQAKAVKLGREKDRRLQASELTTAADSSRQGTEAAGDAEEIEFYLKNPQMFKDYIDVLITIKMDSILKEAVVENGINGKKARRQLRQSALCWPNRWPFYGGCLW